jgi:hypothetical protein
MIRLTMLGWAWLAGMMAWLCLMPRPWNQIAFVMNMPLLLSIPRMNRRLAQAREADEAG